MKNSLLFMLTIVGTIIGAGFATGQEIYSFFLLKSTNILYFILSCIIMIIAAYKIYLLSKEEHIYEYPNVFLKLYKGNLGNLIYYISVVFLFFCFSIAVSGTGTMLYEQFDFNYFIGVFIVIIISLASCFFGIKGVVVVNAILTPFIIFFIILIGIMANYNAQAVFFNMKAAIPLTYAFLYGGYNIFSIIPIAIDMAKEDKKVVKSAFFLSFLAMILCGGTIFISLKAEMGNVGSMEIPFLYIAKKAFENSDKIYIMVLFCSMVTTAVACFYGFVNGITSSFGIKKANVMLFSVLLCAFISFFPFSALVRTVYPLFGVVGIIIIVTILLKN